MTPNLSLESARYKKIFLLFPSLFPCLCHFQWGLEGQRSWHLIFNEHDIGRTALIRELGKEGQVSGTAYLSLACYYSNETQLIELIGADRSLELMVKR